MSTVEDVRYLLSRVITDAMCDECLAYACDVSLDTMRATTNKLLEADGAFRRGGSCGSCHRTVATIFYRAAVS